jgi:hypothetical protein
MRTVRSAGPGPLDLGDVVLAAPSEIASGILVRADDETRAECSGWVDRWSEVAQDWLRAGDATVRVAPDHTFVVEALDRRGRFRLQMMARGHDVQQVEFVAGARDLRVSLAKACRVVVSALVDAITAECYATLQRVDSLDAEWLRTERDGDRLTWSWEPHGPGAFRLRIEAAGAEPWLDHVLDVTTNGAVDDPRLRDLDFRGRARWLDVQITDASGAPWRQPAAVVVESQGGARRERVCIDSAAAGRLRLPVVGAVDLIAMADGCVPVRAVAAVADARLRLLPAARITLDCADARELPPGIAAHLGWQALAGRWPVAVVERSRDAPRANLPRVLEDGRAAWVVDQLDILQPVLVLRRGEPPWEVLPLGPWSPERFVDGASLELRAEPAALQAALRRLAAK